MLWYHGVTPLPLPLRDAEMLILESSNHWGKLKNLDGPFWLDGVQLPQG